MNRKPYPSDLTDAAWTILEPLLPPEKSVGSAQEVDLREVISALRSVADNGIKRRAMPHDFTAWQTVYGYLGRWSQSGLWEQITVALGRQVRRQVGRNEQPSLVMVDSQSVEIAQKGDQNTQLTEARRPKGANAILSWTYWA